jgi:hypothetical protein
MEAKMVLLRSKKVGVFVRKDLNNSRNDNNSMNTKTTDSQPHSRDANNVIDAHNRGITRNIMDVNNSRDPATAGPQQQHLLPANINAKNRRDASLSRDANNSTDDFSPLSALDLCGVFLRRL